MPKVRWLMLNGFVANFTRFPAIQKFWKLVKIWQSYREFKGGNFFETRCSNHTWAQSKGLLCQVPPRMDKLSSLMPTSYSGSFDWKEIASARTYCPYSVTAAVDLLLERNMYNVTIQSSVCQVLSSLLTSILSAGLSLCQNMVKNQFNMQHMCANSIELSKCLQPRTKDSAHAQPWVSLCAFKPHYRLATTHHCASSS